MSDRERVRNEALERYPMPTSGEEKQHLEDLGITRSQMRMGFIAGRTVTAEQVEAAAKAVCRAHQDMEDDYPWDIQFEDGKEEYRDWARAALTAAGLLIEGDDNE